MDRICNLTLPGQGKRSGARTLIATNKKNRWFFLYGFLKNERKNISVKETEALQALAEDYLKLTDKELNLALQKKKLLEVLYNEETK